jgi:iron complex transport system ATP-binding protein
MIHLKNCTIGYSSALFSIDDILLNKGSIYALIGSNGAGKSTLFSTLTNQLSTLSGTITIASQPLNYIKLKEIAKKVAFVQSKTDYPDFLTVEAYLALGRTPYTNTFGRLAREDHEIIKHVIKRLKIEEFLPKFMHKLSDGERQIMAIASALIQETPVLLLDEPTAFLDYGNRIKIIQLLKEIAVTEEKCIMFSSHDLELCLEEINQFLYIDQAKKKLILADDLTKEILLEKAFKLY